MIIKFSHLYRKMPRDYRQSKLLAVIPINLEDLGLDFILYDISYLDGGEEKQYPLPASGKYLMLLLKSPSGLWTTLRSRWGGGRDKLANYGGHVGEVVECVVVE